MLMELGGVVTGGLSVRGQLKTPVFLGTVDARVFTCRRRVERQYSAPTSLALSRKFFALFHRHHTICARRSQSFRSFGRAS